MEKLREKTTLEKVAGIYSASAKKFENLLNKYKEIEQIMADKKNKKRNEIAHKFDMNYAGIINCKKDLKKELKAFSGEILTDALKDKKVQQAVHNYLYFLEEAEYMYPHARSAVSAYLRERDNGRAL